MPAPMPAVGELRQHTVTLVDADDVEVPDVVVARSDRGGAHAVHVPRAVRRSDRPLRAAPRSSRPAGAASRAARSPARRPAARSCRSRLWTYFTELPCAPTLRTNAAMLGVVRSSRHPRHRRRRGSCPGRSSSRRRGRSHPRAPRTRTRPATARRPRRRRGRASAAIGRMRSIGAVCPNRCTGAITLVRGVIAASMAAGIDQQVLVVDVDEDGHRADARCGLGRRDERVGRHDDLVAGPDADRAVGQFERVRAVGDADRRARRRCSRRTRARRPRPPGRR